MSTDATSIALGKIDAAFDRFQEAHWWIHCLEQWYHHADQFRWHFNAFLKAIKETPQLLKLELQNCKGFTSWFNSQNKRLQGDPLLQFLSQKRDHVVHHGMLVPISRGMIGITEGRGIKLGFSAPIDPREDSDAAMTRYIRAVAIHQDFLGLLVPDEDSQPCVQREWRLVPLDEEVIDLATKAWLAVGETITATVRWLGADVPDLALNCRHSSSKVQFKLFDRNALLKELQAMRTTKSEIPRT